MPVQLATPVNFVAVSKENARRMSFERVAWKINHAYQDQLLDRNTFISQSTKHLSQTFEIGIISVKISKTT